MKKQIFFTFFCLFSAILLTKTTFASERFQQSFCDTWTGEIIKVNPKISYDIYETAQEALKNPGNPAWTKDSVYSMQWNPFRPFRMIRGHMRSGIVYNKRTSTLDLVKINFPKDNQTSIFILSPILFILCFIFYRFKKDIIWLLFFLLIWAVTLDIAFDVFKNSPMFSTAAIAPIAPLSLISDI